MSFSSINGAFEGKYTDFKSYSLKYKKALFYGIIELILSIIALPIGIIVFYSEFGNRFILLILGSICFILGLITILLSRDGFIQVKIITKLLNSQEKDKLFSFFNHEDLSKKSNQIAFVLAFFALLELAPNDLYDYTNTHLESLYNSPYINYSTLFRMNSLLAGELNYPISNDIFTHKETKRRIPLEQSKQDVDDIDLGIPITKVYFIDKLPVNTRSMISGLPIELKERIIVACPYCGNMAEKELLENWLLKNNICPVCKRNLSIDELALVKLST